MTKLLAEGRVAAGLQVQFATLRYGLRRLGPDLQSHEGCPERTLPGRGAILRIYLWATATTAHTKPRTDLASLETNLTGDADGSSARTHPALKTCALAIGLAQRHLAQFKWTRHGRWVGLRMQRSSSMISTRKPAKPGADPFAS
jgi:hypothetical protein